jgi:hypothetical protein
MDDNNDATKKAQLDIARHHLEVGKQLNPRSAHATLRAEHVEYVINMVWKKYPDVLSATFDSEIESILKSHPQFFSTLEPVKREMPSPADLAKMKPEEKLEWNTTGRLPPRLVPKNLTEEQKVIANLSPKEKLAWANKRLHDAAVKAEADKRAKKI